MSESRHYDQDEHVCVQCGERCWCWSNWAYSYNLGESDLRQWFYYGGTDQGAFDRPLCQKCREAYMTLHMLSRLVNG